MADKFTEDFLRAMNGKTTGVSAPAVSPSTSGADNFTKQYLAAMGAGETAANVQTPAAPYKLQTVLNPAAKATSVTAPKAASPQTTAPKTETAKQTTATETEFDPVTGFELPTTKAALADANVFGKKVASGLDTLRLSNTANPKDYVLDETTGFMMPSSDFGEAVIQKGLAAAVGTVRNIGNEASYLLQQVGRRAEGMNSGDYVMELDPATGFELPTPKSTDTSPLKTTFNFGRKYQEAADTRFKKYETDPINKAIGDVSTGVGGMVPSIVSHFIVPGSGIWVMATGAAGGATEEALKNGASNEAALTYGIAVGAIEAATEKIADGLGGTMGKGWSDEWVSNVIKQVCQKESTAKAINAFAGVLGEGFEEWIAEYAEAYANKLMVGQDERNFKEISGDALYSFAIGSLISVVMQGADTKGMSQKSINPKSAGEQAAAQCIQSMSQNTDNSTVKTGANVSEGSYTTPTSATSETYSNSVENQQGTQTVRGILSGEVTNSKAEAILADPALKSAFEEISGETLTGTKSEMRRQIKDYAAFLKAKAEIAAKDGIGAKTAKFGYDEAETQTKPVPNTANATEANTEQRGVAGEKAQPPQSKGIFPQGSLGAKLTSELPEGVGAAENGFAGDYNAWQMDTKASDFHPEGENAARPVDLPKVNPQGENTMKTAATVMESANTPDTRVAQIEQYMADGNAAYVPVTDADANTAATASIEEKGWDKSLTDWTADVRSGKVSKQLVAEGAALLNNAANSVATAQQYLDIFNDYATLLHNAGQSLQAARLLKQLSPEGRLYGIQKSVESMVEEIKGGENIKLSDELVDKYRNAKTDAERDAVIAEMQDDVAKQIPSSAMDKWTALRYVNMLGNFKTQVRNVAGNTAMTLGAMIKRRVNAALESVVSAVTGGKYQKTASFGWSPAIFRAALQDFQTVKSAAMGEGKYADTNVTGEFARGVNDKRVIFKNNGTWGTDEGNTALARSAAAKGLRSATNAANAVMEAYRRVTNSAMEGGDYVFSIVNYADALSSYLKAHGVKADAVKAAMNGNLTTSLEAAVSPELLDAARTYAIKEAQEATFRDTNAASKWASQVGRGKNTPKFVKTIAEGTVPFRKTPANVLVRGVEYSPLGAFGTAVKAAELAKGAGNVTGADVINSLSKTMTGTGIFMVGYALAKAGLLRIKDDDDKKEAFDKLTGHQDYALELPNGLSITLDWVSPSSMSLFTGAAWYQNMVKNGFQVKDIEKTLTSLADPMLEMSMVSGISDTLNNIKYSDSSLMQLVLSSTINYLSQGLTNSLLGQAERTAETVRKTTYVGKDSALPSWLDRSIGKASAKTPGWDYKQQDYINAWGNTQSSGALGERIFNNFFNPSYVSKVSETPVDKELSRLYELNGDGSVFPKTADKSFTVNGRGYDLSGDEYSRYQQTYGQTAFKALDTLFKSSEYKAMSDEEKAKAVSGIYTDATTEAKRKIVEGRGEMYLPTDGDVKKVDGYKAAGLSEDNAYSLYKAMDALVPETGKSEVSNQQKAKVVVQQGYGPKQTAALVGSLWNQSGAEEKKTLLPSLNVAQRLVTMYVSGGDSKLVSMTVPRSFSENNVAYTLTDAEMELFQTTYADYFNRNANNVMSEENLLRLREDAYNRAKYAVLRGRK